MGSSEGDIGRTGGRTCNGDSEVRGEGDRWVVNCVGQVGDKGDRGQVQAGDMQWMGYRTGDNLVAI